MSRSQLDEALETEQNGVTANQEAFQQAKDDKKWQEANKLQNKVNVGLALIEKVKLHLVKLDCHKLSRKNDEMNGTKMDEIRQVLDTEILESTNNYKNKLKDFV